MAVFKYTARNDKNHVISGTMEATSRQDVVKNLRQRGYFPTDIEEEGALNKNIEFDFMKKLSLKQLALFSRQFAFTLQSGTPMLRCIELCMAQTESKLLKDILRRVKEEVKRGRLLSDALKYEEAIPPFMVNMIAAGESSGNLDTVMYELSEYYDKLYKQERKINSAMTYPKVVMVFAICIVVFLLIKVVPTFIDNLQQAGAELPLPTRMVLGVSNFVKSYWYIVLILVLLGVAIKKIVLDKDTGFIKWRDSFKLSMPLFGKINRQVIASRFANTLHILNNSGMPIIKSIEISTKVLENSFIEEKMEYVKEDIKRGNLIGKTMEDMNIFPLMLTQMITVGEETGSLDEILKKTAEYYDEEAEVAIDKLITMIEPLLIIGLAGVVLVIILAIMLPMFSLMDSINGLK